MEIFRPRRRIRSREDGEQMDCYYIIDIVSWSQCSRLPVSCYALWLLIRNEKDNREDQPDKSEQEGSFKRALTAGMKGASRKESSVPAEICGFLLVNAASVGTTYYMWKHGALSYFIGTDGDTLNISNCSGPEAWAQNSSWAKAALILPFVIWIPNILLNFVSLGFLTDLALLIVSSIAVANEENQFHKSLEIFEIVYSSFKILGDIASLCSRN